MKILGKSMSNMSENDIEQQRKEIVEKWRELGFLDGLSGKTSIAHLYECEASKLIKMDTDEDDLELD